MCAILGAYSNKPLAKTTFQKALDILAHRGPDAEGIFFSVNGQLGLGHRRLSIIDLRTSANQPMTSPDGRWTIVYNGEVYNYREIREILKRKEVGPFKTDSDTEVILMAWMHWGCEAPQYFNGMFAFAIWDNQTEELWVCRDRMGIKPLYYSLEGGFNFASELKGIRNLLKQPLKISSRAVQSFLHLGFIPEPESIYHEVKKFPAGYYGRYTQKDGLELKCYWKPEDQITVLSNQTEQEALAAINQSLRSSIEFNMVSDVPFGTFLSGGTDSSLVTAIASNLSKKPLKTFSIGFKDAKFNETGYARRVAQHLGTDHTEFVLTEKEAIPFLESMPQTYDEPFADTSAIPTMFISQLARRDVTVILTGDGGDELFMGYGAYDWANRLQNKLLKAAANPIRKLLSLGSDRYKRVAGLFDPDGLTYPRSHIFSQEQYFFSNSEVRALLTSPDDGSFYRYTDPGDLNRSLSPAELQAFFDLKVYLRDDLLVKVDRGSMRYGLECRVPLLDYRLVTLALNLSKDLKVLHGERKWILKKLLEGYLPVELIYRPKWGFSVPLSKWLKGDLRYLIDEYLNDSVVENCNVVKSSYVRDLKSRFLRGEDHLFNRIWVLIVLHIWIGNSHKNSG